MEDADIDKDVLFGTPPDLSCPITQEVFLDPVLTAAGQVGESWLLLLTSDYCATPTCPAKHMLGPALKQQYATCSRSAAAVCRSTNAAQ